MKHSFFSPFFFFFFFIYLLSRLVTLYTILSRQIEQKKQVYISPFLPFVELNTIFSPFFFFFARKIRFWKDSTRCQFSLEKKSRESLSKNILHLDDIIIDWIFRKGRKLTRECWIKYVFTIKNVYGDFFLKRSKVIRLYK